jgi:hypothetical protein
MTSTIRDQVARRTRGPRTLAGALATALAAQRDSSRITWPSTRYQADPGAFAREVLDVVLWAKQIEILEAVREHKRVAARSGHKIGKSLCAAVAALWFYCSFPRARVMLTGPTSRQIDGIIWREIRMLVARARVAIDGEMHELARSGLKVIDFREISGFTAKEAEAVAGVSGANLLYVVDEASGVDDGIFEAIEGNRAGGARVLLLGNPTRTEGEFFEAFHAKRDFYRTIHVSSEDTPNAKSGRELVPGLAGAEWIEEKRLEWGVDSPLYKVRVRGEFVRNEEGKVISLHLIGEAEKRWRELDAAGDLQIGIDPAGPGEGGDESAFAVRRGRKIVEIVVRRGLDADAHVLELQSLLTAHVKPRERAVVVVDRGGPVGQNAYGALTAHAERKGSVLEVFGVDASDRAQRQPRIYDRMRDELLASLVAWLRDGGAIPEDAKLAKELHAPEWVQQVTGRLKVTPKTDIRKLLGRSPDRADAVALAVWAPVAYAREDLDEDVERRPRAQRRRLVGGFDQHDVYEGGINPYGADPFRGGYDD